MKIKRSLSVILTAVMLLSIFNLAAFAADSGLTGDVNKDGKITVVDAKWILQNVAGSRSFDEQTKALADVNSDNKVTVVDAKWVLQNVAGLRDLNDIYVCYPEYGEAPDFGALYGVKPTSVEYYDFEGEPASSDNLYQVYYSYAISDMPVNFDINTYFNLLSSAGFVKCTYDKYVDDEGHSFITYDVYNPDANLDIVLTLNEEEGSVYLNIFPCCMLSYSDFSAPDIGKAYNVEYSGWYSSEYDKSCTYEYDYNELKAAGYTYESLEELCNKKGFSFFESHKETGNDGLCSGDAQFINYTTGIIFEIRYNDEFGFFNVTLFPIISYDNVRLQDFGEFASVNCGSLSYGISGVTYGYNLSDFKESLIKDYKKSAIKSGYVLYDSYDYEEEGCLVHCETLYNEELNAWLTLTKNAHSEMLYVDLYIAQYEGVE